ncbi:MAG: Uma2 family endonuclease [Hyphomicrobiaceae bacterium]|nr:Uma2 family endonuclease [Hyphomicrobiaceae bacterium]
MNSPTFLRVDKATFLDFMSGLHQGRYEFEEGYIVQQTPGATLSQARIGLNACVALLKSLEGTQYVAAPELGVETSDTIRYPDVVVVSGALSGTIRATTEPVLIVEVLSPSTIHTDLEAKPEEYASLPSLEAYIVLSPHDVAALAWVRGSDRLFPASPTEYGAGGRITVPALGLSISLDDVYAGIALTPPETPQGAPGPQPG